MPKKIIKRYIPDHKTIREHKHLRILGPLLEDPNLLHLNRRSVSGAFSVGLFIAFVPVPFQMLLAAIAAIIARVNLPISVALVWVSNPLTMPPLFYFAYKLGAWVLGMPELDFDFELSFHWLEERLELIWQPFLFGCFLVGSFLAVVGGVGMRYVWRYSVVSNWNQRKARRAEKLKQAPVQEVQTPVQKVNVKQD